MKTPDASCLYSNRSIDEMIRKIVRDYEEAHNYIDPSPDDIIHEMDENGVEKFRAQCTEWMTKLGLDGKCSLEAYIVYLVTCLFDNQGDEGGEGWLFACYLRDEGLLGSKFDGIEDIPNEWWSEQFTSGICDDFSMMVHRAISWQMPTVQAYAVRKAAEWTGLDIDRLQLSLIAARHYK